MPRLAGLALAAALLGGAAGAAEEALDFELGGEDGFVRLAELPPRVTVVNFWRSDCPPCLREMPLLAATARARPELRVVAVAVQKRSETAAGPLRPEPPILLLHAPADPWGLLKRFGNRSGALPYTLVLDRERRPCARQAGEVDAAWLADAVARCGG